MNEKIYFNTKDISSILGICYHKALSFVKYSGIKYNKIGNIYIVNKNDLYDFLNNNQDINLKEAEYNASIGTHTQKKFNR